MLENEQFNEVFCPAELGLLTLMRIRGPLNPWKKTRFFFAAMFAISWWSLAAWNAEDTKSPGAEEPFHLWPDESRSLYPQPCLKIAQVQWLEPYTIISHHAPNGPLYIQYIYIYICICIYIYTHIFMSWIYTYIYIIVSIYIYIIITIIINVCLHTHNHTIDVGIHTISNVSFIHMRQS